MSFDSNAQSSTNLKGKSNAAVTNSSTNHSEKATKPEKDNKNGYLNSPTKIEEFKIKELKKKNNN